MRIAVTDAPPAGAETIVHDPIWNDPYMQPSECLHAEPPA
jgi:hypothetical protein